MVPDGFPSARNQHMVLGMKGMTTPVRIQQSIRQLETKGWIGNGVLDGFLEDESLFGEFLRAPVCEGGVESLVVGPPHIVVGVGA